MDGITLGLIIVILFIIITLQPFGPSANSAIVGGLAALAAIVIWQSDAKPPGAGRNPEALRLLPDENSTISGAVAVGSGANVRVILKTILRNAKNAFVAGASGLAALGTLGAGGDTIIEVLALALDAGMYLGELAMIFLEDTSEYGPTLRKIWQIDFRAGVNGVRDRMIEIYNGAGVGVTKMAAYVRGIVSNAIEWMLGLFGRVLSALIPNDSSITGWIFSESLIAAIRAAANNVFWILNSAYNKVVPDAVHAILQHPEKLKETIIVVIDMIRKYIVTRDGDSWAAWAAKHVARQGAINVTAVGTALIGAALLPALFIPAAVIIGIGGSIMNVAMTAGLGRNQVDAILAALYTREFDVPSIGKMTAVDALVMLIGKAIPLTFASMFAISDYTTVVDTKITVVQVPTHVDVAPKLETNHSAVEGVAVTDTLGDLPAIYTTRYNVAMEGRVDIDDVLNAAKDSVTTER